MVVGPKTSAFKCIIGEKYEKFKNVFFQISSGFIGQKTSVMTVIKNEMYGEIHESFFLVKKPVYGGVPVNFSAGTMLK